MSRVQDRIDDLFATCGNSLGDADLKSVGKAFWMCLNNSVSLVDLAGVFTVSLPSSDSETLNQILFSQFFKAFARTKYATEADFCEKLLDEVKESKGLRINYENPVFSAIVDKNVIRTLLKYDLPLRKAYSNFCGQQVRVGGVLTWEEVKRMSIDMEIDGFISFAGAHALIPELFSTSQCESFFREVVNRFPLTGNSASTKPSILFPQFQLLLAMMSSEKKDDKQSDKNFAKKSGDGKQKPLAVSLNELLRDIGLSKLEDGKIVFGTEPTRDNTRQTGSVEEHGDQSSTELESNLFSGAVAVPSTDRPENLYRSASNHGRQAMMLRMEHLFDEIESKVLAATAPESDILRKLAEPAEDVVDVKVRLPTKPVVIGDAVPVPAICPEVVEQLLEAALAHHNLGSFEEALKFLEAARIQSADINFHFAAQQPRLKVNSEESFGAEHHPNATSLPPGSFDIRMYIILCKGNVYQSCGDDEQSLLQFMEGWTIAKENVDEDWEMICLNSIGMMAYYNLRYDVASLCFSMVSNFREMNYGTESVDTATAWNNEASCLYCLNKRGEARLKFEMAWNTICNSVGHRAPRAVTAWKNLERARRSHAPLHSKRDMAESMKMRPDVERLLMGGTFTIQAIPPPEGGGKKKKKVGGGKKKKK